MKNLLYNNAIVLMLLVGVQELPYCVFTREVIWHYKGFILEQ